MIDGFGLRGLDAALADRDNVYEVWIKPQASATRNRSRLLWTYPQFLMGNPRKRKVDQCVGVR